MVIGERMTGWAVWSLCQMAAVMARMGLTLVGCGAGEREADGQAVKRAQQVQPQPPEIAGMGGAVAVSGVSGQVRAAYCLLRPHSTGVESTSHTSSPHRLVSQASMRISQHMVAASLRTRLLYPDWPGRYGNRCRR